MRCRRTAALAAIILALALARGTLAREAKGPKCFPREGHCVAVVNGQLEGAMSSGEVDRKV